MSRHMLNPCGWFGADYIEIGSADMFGFTEFIVLEKGPVRRKYLPERTCQMESVWGTNALQCSECCSYVSTWDAECEIGKINYCPTCGAKVVE